MKYVTVKLTEDQKRFVEHLLKGVLDNLVTQGHARRAIAQRTLEALGSYDHKVDHSASEAKINAKLASGELKLPKI